MSSSVLMTPLFCKGSSHVMVSFLLSFDCDGFQYPDRCLWYHSAWLPTKGWSIFSRRCEWLIPNSLHGPRLELRLKPASVLIHMTDPSCNLLFKVHLGCFYMLYLISQLSLFSSQGVIPLILMFELPFNL